MAALEVICIKNSYLEFYHYMKISLIVYVLLLLSYPCFCQTETLTKKWSVGVNASLDINDRKLIVREKNTTNENIAKSRNVREVRKPGYAFSIRIVRELAPIFVIESGIGYANMGFQTARELLFPYSQTPVSPIGTYKNIYKFHYIELPLLLTATTRYRKMQFFLSGGIINQLLIKSTSITIDKFNDGNKKRNTVEDKTNYNKCNMALALQFGANYHIDKNSFLKIGTMLRYDMLDIIDAPITAKLWGAGIQIGYYRNF